MGVLHRARHQETGAMAAVKLLPESQMGDPERRARFLREAILVSAIQHPNICRLLGSGETPDGRFFLATELYSGRTLEQYLLRHDPPLDRALDIAIQVASGLEAAHKRGVIHRDIKPANLFLVDDGGVKILDFGLARLEGGGDLTMIGQVLGTAVYGAPEQLLGERVDVRIDIWALGVILYEMVAGRIPFPGATRGEVIDAVLVGRARPVAEARPEAPAGLQQILDLALARDREARYATAREMRQDLEALREGRLEIAPPPTAKQPVVAARAEATAPRKEQGLLGRLLSRFRLR